MFSKKSVPTKLLALILAFSFFTSPHQAKALSGQTGQMLGGLLIVAGAFLAYQGYTQVNASCPAGVQPSCGYGWAKIAGGIAGMAGGLVAMNQNKKNKDEMTMASETKTTDPKLDPDWPKNPDGSPMSIPDKCKEFPQLCTCNDASCNQPSLQIPPKEELDELMRRSMKANPSDTTSLGDALAQLNENYDKAKEAANAFNQQSAAGAFDTSGSGISSDGLDDSSGTEDYVGLNKDGSDAGSKSGGGFDFSSNPFGNNADLDNLKKMRGEPDPVTNVGMNLRNNNTNKILTIFERAARVLRGDRNRDISLAKIEWTRKAAAKKQGKGPVSMPAPKQ